MLQCKKKKKDIDMVSKVITCKISLILNLKKKSHLVNLAFVNK
jgi:hypothetical protein